MLCWYGNYITQIRTNEKQRFHMNHEWWVERFRAWSAMGNKWCLHICLFTQFLGQNKPLWVNSFALANNKTIVPSLMCFTIPVPHHFQIWQTSNPLCKSITGSSILIRLPILQWNTGLTGEVACLEWEHLLQSNLSKQAPLLSSYLFKKVTFFLKFIENFICIEPLLRGPLVLKDHFFFVPKMTS